MMGRQGRRDILLGMCGGVFVSALPLRGTAQISQAPLQTLSSPGTTGTLVTRTSADTLLTVAVFVNGAGPFRFIVDTGAERTIVTDTLVARLSLSIGSSILVSGLARQISASVARVNDLRYGPFSRTDLDAPVLPYAAVGADGILGLDVIHNSRVVFDFKHHVINVDRVNDPAADEDPSIQTVIVRAKGTGGRLRMSDCRVDGVDAQAFVDTGAEVSVCNGALYQNLRMRNPKLTPLGEAVLTGVTGGTVRGPDIPTGRIELQSVVFSGGSVVAADIDDFALWGLTDQPALLIGMDYLRQLAAITVDFRSKEVKFSLSKDSSGRP